MPIWQIAEKLVGIFRECGSLSVFHPVIGLDPGRRGYPPPCPLSEITYAFLIHTPLHGIAFGSKVNTVKSGACNFVCCPLDLLKLDNIHNMEYIPFKE